MSCLLIVNICIFVQTGQQVFASSIKSVETFNHFNYVCQPITTINSRFDAILSKLSVIKACLQSRKLRVTHSRLAVATILIRNESSFFTPEEIYTRIVNSKKLSCDQVSVYRVLSTFEELGLVSKNVFQGEAARYKYTGLAKQGQHNHQHFFKCNVCDVIEALEGCFVRKKERELTQLGYENLEHHLEISGTCPSCV